MNTKEQVHSFLLDVENMVKNRGDDKLEGICGLYIRAINLNFDRLCAQHQIKDGTAARNELHRAMHILMAQWPEHSGHVMFPVKAADYGDPEAAYLDCKDLWGSHPYGDNRRRLLAWMIEQTK